MSRLSNFTFYGFREDVAKFFAEHMLRDEEGIVIKKRDSLYYCNSRLPKHGAFKVQQTEDTSLS